MFKRYLEYIDTIMYIEKKIYHKCKIQQGVRNN